MTWLTVLKLYSPALVLALWSVVCLAGATSDKMAGAGLALMAVTVCVAEWERHALRKKDRRER